MECLRCKHDNRTNARFCEACGQPLESSPVAQISSQAVDGERRQATVLFADLSGYTALGEYLDPEELDELVARIKSRAARIVERHGGIVNQFRGDEIFALFGVPVAHDDDPVRAVRAARALHAMVRLISPDVEQRTGSPLRFHSSVSSGLIVSSERDLRDGAIGVTGDAVNTGARLVALARPDEILLNPETREQIEDFFETSPLEPFTLKGKTTPVVAYRVEKETPTQSRFEAAERRGLTRFAGRETDLSILQRCLEKADAGERQFVTVVGEPGVGKSRLVFEFRHSLDRSAITVLQGHCQSFGVATPYLPFIDALRRGLQLRGDESAEVLHSKVVSNILAIDPKLERYLPHYLHLLSISTLAHRLPDGLQGIELRRALEDALVALVASNSEQKPIVWIIEDWHWTDDASVAALQALVQRLPSHRLMLIVLYRPEYEGTWQVPHHTEIALQPLAVHDTEAIIHSVLDASSLQAGLGSLVHERTAGNPFFTEEIATALLEQGHVVVSNGQAQIVGELETLDLPETVQATIRARIDRLDRGAREILRIASVLGREFNRRLLERICRPDMRLTQALEQFGAQDLIQTLRTGPDAEYMFKHVLTQVVVYETLLHQQRKALHAKVGNAIESLYPERLEEHYEALAYHYRHSADTEKAVRFVELAGDKAAGIFSLPEARKHYSDAIGILDALGASDDRSRSRIDITLKLAKASHYATSGDTLRTLEVARELAQQLADEHRLARISYWMGGVYRMLGNHPQVFTVLGQCVQLAEALGDAELQAFSLHVMGRACYLTGDYAKGIAYMERAISISERLGNHSEISYSFGFCADCHAWLGNFDAAISLAERSLELAKEIGDIQRQAGSNWYRAAVYCMHGDWENGLEAAVACTDLARRIGGAYLIGCGIATQGWPRFMLGERTKGADMLQEGFAIIQGSGSHQGTGLYASMVADHLVLAGMSEQARIYARKALSFYGKFGEGNGEAPAHRALALAASQVSPPDWSVVDQHFTESARAARHRSERPHLAITLFRQGQLLLARGDSDAAHALLLDARQMFSDMDMGWWLESVDRSE